MNNDPAYTAHLQEQLEQLTADLKFVAGHRDRLLAQNVELREKLAIAYAEIGDLTVALDDARAVGLYILRNYGVYLPKEDAEKLHNLAYGGKEA